MLNYKIKRIAFAFCMSASITVCAQIANIDSLNRQSLLATEVDRLKSLLSKTTIDTVRVNLLYKISDAYSFVQPDIAFEYAVEALNLAQEINFKKGQARALTRIANLFYNSGEIPKALEKHLASLKITEELRDEVGTAATYNNIALIYSNTGSEKDGEQAIAYYLKAVEKFEILKDSLKEIATLLNIVNAYEVRSLPDSALNYGTKAYKIALQMKDINFIATILANLGHLYYVKQDITKALVSLRMSLYYLQISSDSTILSIVYSSLAKCFDKIGKADSSIYYSEKALQIAENESNLALVANLAHGLDSLYKSIGKDDLAANYNRLARLSEKMINTYELKEITLIRKLQHKEDIRQTERELKRKEEEKKERKKWNSTLQMIGITAFIVTFFIMLLILSQKKINPRVIEILTILGLLLVFEFIMIFIHPIIGTLTHHTPILMLFIFVGIAAIIGPSHHYLNHWLREKLLHRHKLVQQPVSQEKK